MKNNDEHRLAIWVRYEYRAGCLITLSGDATLAKMREWSQSMYWDFFAWEDEGVEGV